MIEYALVACGDDELHADQVLMLVETRQDGEEIAAEMRRNGQRVSVVAVPVPGR